MPRLVGALAVLSLWASAAHAAQGPIKPCQGTSSKPPWCEAVPGDRPSGWLGQGRSEVMSQHGVVATSQPLATQAGLRILQQGGNAIDAAVATAAVLSVTEPMMVGPAADLYAIIYVAKENKVYQLTSSGMAPTGASVEYYNSLGFAWDSKNWGYGSGMPGGILSAPVPGGVWGWDEAVRRFGSMKLAKILRPAIDYAENGFPVSEVIANPYWELPPVKATDPKTQRPGWKNVGCLPCQERDPDAVAAWYIDGKPPVAGQIFRNPDLAKTFRLLGERGRDVFYKGEIAKAIVAKSKALGGTMTLEDLASYRGEWVEPAHSTFNGYDLYETMAPSQAWNTGELLNLLEACVPQWTKKALGTEKRLSELGPTNPLYWHLLVEAKKVAFEDLYAYNSDPAVVKLGGVPANEYIQKKLLSKEHARSLCDRVDPARATDPHPGGDPLVSGLGDTIYLTTADRWGNMVSWVNSNYSLFGSGIGVPGYGFVLANRLQQFTMDPKSPNRIAPRKRPYNTISAAFLMKDGKPFMTMGLMGGDMQVQGHAQVLVNVLELGANVQAATDMARYYHNEVPNTLGLEGQLFNSTVGAALKAQYGHDVRQVNGRAVGGYQAIVFEPSGLPVCAKGVAPKKANACVPADRVNGVYRAGSDHRKDGQAAGW